MNPFTTVEDLIIDPSFRRWILHQDPEARAQWQAYLAAHPGKKALIEKARLFLEELPKVNYQMPPQEKDLLWGQIAQKADTQSPVIYPGNTENKETTVVLCSSFCGCFDCIHYIVEYQTAKFYHRLSN